ncbi:hypothetical protein ACH5RR_016867 [Cinchona calisaya]|uniref:BTB domain-containing protein n=1 Tax=Cinchona calisaya TaxID=153742 RepID=A0ABD2ZYE7_9GENT
MACAICVPFSSSLHRYLCQDCFRETLKLISSVSNLIGHGESISQHSTKKQLEDALKVVGDLEFLGAVGDLELLKDQLTFLTEFSVAFRNQVHTDILVKSADLHGHAIPAHKAVLATRSKIFRNILDSDSCKAPPGDSITLPEMNHEELEAFLRFLYTGHLTTEEVEKHVYSLMRVAHKYEISFLESFCKCQILKGLGLNNALDALEISDTCSKHNMKAAVTGFIVENLKDIVLSPNYDDFALKHPHLSLEIMKASVRNPSKQSTT